eukprot:scaffold2927_cov408-Prasinococcus_capsulatus_cf.AAC.6
MGHSLPAGVVSHDRRPLGRPAFGLLDCSQQLSGVVSRDPPPGGTARRIQAYIYRTWDFPQRTSVDRDAISME